MRFLALAVVCISLPACKVYNSFSSDAALIGASANPVVRVLARNNCFECHASWTDIETDQQWQALYPGYFEPGSAEDSVFYKVLKKTRAPYMPPSPNPALSSADLSIIKDWIDEMQDFRTELVGSLQFQAAWPVITQNCLSCHAAVGGTSTALYRNDHVVDDLLQGSLVQDYWRTLNFTVPSGSSSVKARINHTPGVGAMPIAYKMTDSEILKIEQWIETFD
jgi:hypothetical protein